MYRGPGVMYTAIVPVKSGCGRCHEEVRGMFLSGMLAAFVLLCSPSAGGGRRVLSLDGIWDFATDP